MVRKLVAGLIFETFLIKLLRSIGSVVMAPLIKLRPILKWREKGCALLPNSGRFSFLSPKNSRLFQRFSKIVQIAQVIPAASLVTWWRIWHTLPVVPWIEGAEYFKRGEFRRAAEAYRRGLERYPAHRASSCARLDYAYCLSQLNELNLALDELRTLLHVGTTLRDGFLLMAKIELTLGRFEAATKTMRAAREIFAEDTQIIVCYSQALISAHLSSGTKSMTEDLLEARGLLRALKMRLLLTDPLSVCVDTAIAQYEIRLGDQGMGDQILSRVLATGSAPVEAIILRAERSLEEGRVTQAREQLERAVRHCPNDPRPLILLARSYLVGGEQRVPEFAVQLATSAADRSHWENPEALACLAEAYRAIDDLDTSSLVATRLLALTSIGQLNLDFVSQAGEELERLRQLKPTPIS